MSTVLTIEDVRKALDSLIEKKQTFVTPRQMLSLSGITFTDEQWEKLQSDWPDMMKDAWERGKEDDARSSNDGQE